MTRTTDLLVAHIAHPTSSPSALAQALEHLPAEVRHFCDPSETLKQLPLTAEVVFLVERSALSGGGMMWLIVLAEARRGPIVLIEDERDRDPGAALRAGVQSVVYAADFDSSSAVEKLVIDAFEHFERRATNRTVRWDGVLPNRSSSAHSRAAGVDTAELRAYLRDSMNEFRTPLTAVVEFASLLDDGLAGPLNEKQSDYTAYILEACAELLELHGDFRQSAGLRLGGNQDRVESFGLIHAIEEALIGVRSSRVSFRLDSNDESVRVRCERNALIMVVARMAQRAAKCSTRDSEIVVRMRAVAGVQVEIAVLDNGPVPTESDIRLLDEGTVCTGDLSKSVTQVFGVGIELARAVLLRQGAPLELSATADGQGQMAFSLPIVAG